MIPGNDDAIRAVGLYVKAMADAVLEGKNGGADLSVRDEFVEVTDEVSDPVAGQTETSATEEQTASQE